MTLIPETSTIPACQDCTTLSGVLLATSVPSSLVPSNLTATSVPPSLVVSSLTTTENGGTNNKRVPTLIPRVLNEPQPLLEPDPGLGDKAQEEFMKTLYNAIDTNQPNNEAMRTTPTDQQLSTWQIPLPQDKGNSINTPIGVTGVWYSFGNTPQNWGMMGMSGCTGVLIVVSSSPDLL